MKYLIFSICLSYSICSYAQEKTISLHELDSLSDKSDSKVLQVVENVPIHKGCEKELGNANKKKCMSQKIAILFSNEFDTQLPKDSKIKPGLKRIAVIFKVDNDGNVRDIEAEAEDEYLRDEAKRVARLIPQMTPGMQRGKPVIVPYTLPLRVVMTKAIEKEKEARFPIFRGCDEDFNYENSKKCTTKKVMDFIKLNFDYQMADQLFPLEQSTQFQLDFIINKKGKIEQVNAKANHKAIAIHAIKLAKRLPKFKKPGTVNGEPVAVPFSLLMTVYFQ